MSDQLLGGLLEQADYHSPGRFTIALEKALEKVGRLSLRQPARWLLFAVQAAVALGAEGVQLTVQAQSCAAVLMFASGPVPMEDPEFLLSSSQAGPGARFLRDAILWGRALRPRTFRVRFEHPGGGYELELNQESARPEARPGSASAALHLEWEANEACPKRAAHVHQELSERLSLCPVPLLLQGRLLNSGSPAELVQGPCAYLRLVLAEPTEEALLAVRLRPALTVSLGEQRRTRTREGQPFPQVERLELAGAIPAGAALCSQPGPADWEVARWHENEQEHRCGVRDYTPARLLGGALNHSHAPCRALFGRMASGENQLFLVHYGCRLAPLPLAYLPAQGWSALVAVRSIACDFSGDRPVEGEALQSLVDWTTDQIRYIHHCMSERI